MTASARRETRTQMGRLEAHCSMVTGPASELGPECGQTWLRIPIVHTLTIHLNDLQVPVE